MCDEAYKSQWAFDITDVKPLSLLEANLEFLKNVEIDSYFY